MPTFTLQPEGPFSLSRAADVVSRFPPLSHQPRPGSEVRVGFILDGALTPVAARLSEESGRIRCEVAGTSDIEAARAQVARILSLDHDGSAYPALGRRDPALGALMDAFEGLRPVCFTSPYEAACWAVLSQRISKAQAARLTAGLVARGEERARLDGEEIAVFPSPARLLALSDLGPVPAVKAARLRAIAEAALEGALDATHLRALGDQEAPRRLAELPGIGPFWSSGIYLRACGAVDVFPDEPRSRDALSRLHPEADARALDAIIDGYRPFRMWACFLLRVAEARGVFDQLERPTPSASRARSRRLAV